MAELARASEDMDLLVCGSRGYGALRSAFAGGVSRGLAHNSACPLLLVPRRTTTSAALWRHPQEQTVNFSAVPMTMSYPGAGSHRGGGTAPSLVRLRHRGAGKPGWRSVAQ